VHSTRRGIPRDHQLSFASLTSQRGATQTFGGRKDFFGKGAAKRAHNEVVDQVLDKAIGKGPLYRLGDKVDDATRNPGCNDSNKAVTRA
jgi:hypothetical protein